MKHSKDNTNRPRAEHSVDFVYLLMMIVSILAGCVQDAGGGSRPERDLMPPVLLSVETVDGRTFRLLFDESVRPGSEGAAFQPSLKVEKLDIEGRAVVIRLSGDQEIGISYTGRLQVTDDEGNSLSCLFRFTGWNPRVPDLLINELNPKGSKNTPDCVEIRVIKDGNLGGVILYVGTEDSSRGSLIFPAVEVAAGDYLLIHAKAEGLDEERDETEGTDVSGGKLAINEARDFWIPDAPGLPGTNGAVTLYSRLGGEILDAVLWTNREDDPNDDKQGWTSASHVWAVEIFKREAWKAAGEKLFPSDAVDVTPSTATRSLNRAPDGADSDGKGDWHVVPTGGQTLGRPNLGDVYSP